MSKRYLKTVALVLTLAFVMPVAGRFMDASFHRHFKSPVAEQTTLFQYHSVCPVSGFQLSTFAFQKQYHPDRKRFFNGYPLPPKTQRSFSSGYEQFFLLRAPPVDNVFPG